MSAAISDESSLFLVYSASCPTFFKIPFKVWMMRSWRDSFVGSTLKGSELSISGGKLKDLINRARQADNADMRATTAADHVFFTATVQASPKGMITLDVAFIGNVKDECQYHVMLMCGSYPIWSAVCVCLCKPLITKRLSCLLFLLQVFKYAGGTGPWWYLCQRSYPPWGNLRLAI